MCTTYLGHFDKTRSILVPVSLILKRGPFFRVSMVTVIYTCTRVVLTRKVLKCNFKSSFPKMANFARVG